MKQPQPTRKTWPSQLGKALKSSWISLLIIILVLLLASLDQSDTIVVDLLDHNPGNFALFAVLLMYLSQIVSHYPIYLEYNQNKEHQHREQRTWHLRPVFLGFGLITFKDEHFQAPSRLIGHVRNLWGVFLLGAVFYLLLVVHSRNVEIFEYQPSDVGFWLWFQVIAYIVWGVTTYVVMSWWLDGKRVEHLPPAKLRYYRLILVNTTLILLGAHLMAALFFSASAGWTPRTYWSTYALLLAAAPGYSATRLFRKDTLLKNHPTYLLFISVGGLGSLVLLGLAHFLYFEVNPLVILLAQLITIYGLVVIPMKHYFYYRQEARREALGRFRRIAFVWILPIWLPIFLTWATLAGWWGNDLHQLPLVAEEIDTTKEESPVRFSHFVKDFDNTFTPQDTVYFIASFGGGLKANLWNQLILERLANYGGRNILSHTVAVSGVSGGAIGHSVFAGLYQKHGPPARGDTTLRRQIRELGQKNFVSIDLTYLLGLDLLRELIPNFLARDMENSYDRAKLAMREYSHFVGTGNSMLQEGYRTYWARLYRKEKAAGRFFPAFVANAAGTHIQRGIACSLLMDSTQFDNTFFNSTDLLTFRDRNGHQLPKTLPYLYAASCANRFPIFSPAAKVEQKGHFIDGGYFENSGMLSLLDFYESLKTESKLFTEGKSPKVVFVQIINAREDYLKSLIENPYRIKIKESPELSSILGTVGSISFVPSYLIAKNALAEQQAISARKKNGGDSTGIRYAQIHLPYYVTKQDVKDLLKLSKVKLDDSTQHRMNQSNAMILRMLKSNPYGSMQPPLARMLGRQAVNYMDAALSQAKTWEDLNRILRK